MPQQTLHLHATDTGLDRAAQLLKDGALVALPTETVYGLGADARNGTAVAAIYTAKGRPSFNPLIVHLAAPDDAKKYVVWNAPAQALARAFWPGPLTLVLPLLPDHGLSSLVTAGLPTVALRVPAHPTSHRLLTAFGGPVAAPSANPSGQISPTTAGHVLEGLSGRIAAVLDDGPCTVGVESTIIGFDGSTPVLLREGGITCEQITDLLGQAPAAPQGSNITAPGQLASHYAPRGNVRLNAQTPHKGEHMLGFGAVDGVLNLSPDGDLAEAAANLFEYFHRLDALGGAIAVAPIPQMGLGRAINDRLARAAAPRG
ncbi:L-threonylcarbamoyladenylate synthase [uncultured Sulfitobacter sp.]|uniref:L-threonylcarbamoyladenylate synthase n=1 Tax=uncultured Sulfitobacter sp. TaxID=191468 RepID=UPI00260E6D29|nr:L-threonylcarbamoyladenylate synthase [uncultured Sulfitobacter sp.]